MKNFGLLSKVRPTVHNPLCRALLLAVALLALSPHPLRAADPGDGKISLSLKNVPLTQFFREIESLTHYKFFYKSSQVASVPNVSLEAADKSVEEILGSVFAGTNLTFTFNEDQIVIDVRTAPPARPSTVSGTVTGQDGKPIAGVNVVVSGTTRGTSTDAMGRFVLNVANVRGNTLRFSIIGMEPQTAPIDNRAEYRIVLKEGAHSISEVVVTGYQTITKERSTGAYNILDSAALAQSRAQTLIK